MFKNSLFALPAFVVISTLTGCATNEFVGSWEIETNVCEGEFAYQNYPGGEDDAYMEGLVLTIAKVDGELVLTTHEDKEEIPCTETAGELSCESDQTDGPLILTVEGDTMTLESPDSDPCVMTLTRADES